MTAFKKTILGKILSGVSKVIKPVAIVAGSVLGIGAISGVIKGAGAIGGIAGTLKGAGKVLGKVGTSAVNLVSGTTKDEREQVKEVKTEAKAAQDQLDQVQRLIDAGATRARAEQMVGITAAELGSANATQKDEETTKKLDAEDKKTTTAGCAPTVFLIIAALAATAFTIIIL